MEDVSHTCPFLVWDGCGPLACWSDAGASSARQGVCKCAHSLRPAPHSQEEPALSYRNLSTLPRLLPAPLPGEAVGAPLAPALPPPHFPQHTPPLRDTSALGTTWLQRRKVAFGVRSLVVPVGQII